MADWFIGQRVVCVSSKWVLAPEVTIGDPSPSVGCVYTIDDIVPWKAWAFFVLREFPPFDERGRQQFGSAHFRPVDERDADLSASNEETDRPKVKVSA